jgi:hypothetical protein
MDHAGELDTCAARDQLRGEIDDVRAAIALVARGTSTRVTISGLASGQQLLAQLEPEARRARVALIPLWWPDDAGCDLTVCRVDD